MHHWNGIRHYKLDPYNCNVQMGIRFIENCTDCTSVRVVCIVLCTIRITQDTAAPTLESLT